MADYKESSGFCVTCQKRVVGRKEEASHTFWLIATLFSCGLFGIVWLISSFSKASQPFNCSFCGTPLKALTTGSTGNSPSPVLIIGGSIAVLAFIGLIITITGNSVRSRRTEAMTTSQYTEPPKTTLVVKPSAASQSKQNVEQQIQARQRWAQQYQIRKANDGFANAKCTVSGKNNTTLTMRSKAVVMKEAIQTLNNSGYFDEVFEQGFTKLVLEDTVGNIVTITR
jgi:hypothetical protein